MKVKMKMKVKVKVKMKVKAITTTYYPDKLLIGIY